MVLNFIIRIIGDHVGQLLPLVLGYNGWVRLEICADVTKVTLIINNPGLCNTLVYYYKSQKLLLSSENQEYDK